MSGCFGAEFPVDVQFIEIVEPERIVWRNAPAKGEDWAGNPPPSFIRTITFEEDNGRTTLTIRAEFNNAFNRTQIPIPSTTRNALPTRGPDGRYVSGFGTINTTGTITGERQGTLVARFQF